MELATLSRGMAATTALVTTRKMKLIGIVLLVGVLGFCGWNEFDSSPSKEALVPVENEENIGPSKGLASSVFVMEELFPGERVEVSSDLSIEHVSPESALLEDKPSKGPTSTSIPIRRTG
jgi:hypothetical protein